MAALSNARWFLVEWGDGSLSVVNVRAVVNGAHALKVGDEVMVTVRGAKKPGKVVNLSDDRKKLEHQAKPKPIQEPGSKPEPEGPNLYEDLEGGDFSPSGSSWGPDDQQDSSDSEVEVEENTKKIKLEDVKKQYSNKGSKTRTPTLRPEPVIPMSSQTKVKRSTLNFSNKVAKRKIDRSKSMSVQQAIADSTRSQSCVSPKVPQYDHQTQTSPQTANISADELDKVKSDLKQFKNLLSILKTTVTGLRSTLSADHLYETIYARESNDPRRIQDSGSSMVLPSEHRTNDDNLPKADERKNDRDEFENMATPIIKPIRYGLIRHNPNRSKVQPQPSSSNGTKMMRAKMEYVINSSPGSDHSVGDRGELVPIGSGKTLVPKFVFERINWDSYTMATRKLLVAVFPRRILATHSLTGKASPAFTDKPAKLCLDPKKVSDIALEVTMRCKVKESLVRSVITTKCADEYKMFRIQASKEKFLKSKQKISMRLLNDQENLSPDTEKHRTPEGYQSTSYTSYNQTM